VDGRYYGEVHTLRQFRPEDVMQVRYVDSATATATVRGIGSRHVEAAILVEMRRTRSPGTDGGA
jgi:hypothetical protein